MTLPARFTNASPAEKAFLTKFLKENPEFLTMSDAEARAEYEKGVELKAQLKETLDFYRNLGQLHKFYPHSKTVGEALQMLIADHTSESGSLDVKDNWVYGLYVENDLFRLDIRMDQVAKTLEAIAEIYPIPGLKAVASQARLLELALNTLTLDAGVDDDDEESEREVAFRELSDNARKMLSGSLEVVHSMTDDEVRTAFAALGRYQEIVGRDIPMVKGIENLQDDYPDVGTVGARLRRFLKDHPSS